MEKYISFKLKLDKKYNKKFLYISCNNVTRDIAKKYSEECINTYKAYMENHKHLSVIINSTGFETGTNFDVDWGILKDRLTKLTALNDLAKKRIVCTIVILNNSFIKDTINKAMILFPPVRPMKIVSNNDEAIAAMRSEIEKLKN